MNIANRVTHSWDALSRWVWDVADFCNNALSGVYKARWKDVSGAVTLEESWTFILCDTSAGACTPTLPTGMTKGWQIVIQDKSLAGTNNITITRGGTDTINNANTVVISTNCGRKTLICDGAGKWYAA